MKPKQAQVAIEFMVLLMMSAFIIMSLLVSLSVVSGRKQMQQSYEALKDMGKAVQQEMILAAQVNDGYQRDFYLPPQVGRYDYVMATGNASSSGGSYFTIDFQGVQLFYKIPQVYGELQPGFNNVTRQDGRVQVNV